MSFRAQLKEYAKTRMHAQYGTFLLSTILVLAATHFVTRILSSIVSVPLVLTKAAYSSPFAHYELFLNSVFSVMIIPTTAIAFFILPFYPLGLNGTALAISRNEKITATMPFTVGFKNYLRKLGGMAWMHLFIFLWSCLFMIPGIVKAYSYRFTPYILADCPNVSARDALKISMRMTEGIKWELFVFDLSFIGWSLLTALSGGILAIYTIPYYQAAAAALYDSMKNNALMSGRVSAEELL